MELSPGHRQLVKAMYDSQRNALCVMCSPRLDINALKMLLCEHGAELESCCPETQRCPVHTGMAEESFGRSDADADDMR